MAVIVSFLVALEVDFRLREFFLVDFIMKSITGFGLESGPFLSSRVWMLVEDLAGRYPTLGANSGHVKVNCRQLSSVIFHY